MTFANRGKTCARILRLLQLGAVFAVFVWGIIPIEAKAEIARVIVSPSADDVDGDVVVSSRPLPNNRRPSRLRRITQQTPSPQYARLKPTNSRETARRPSYRRLSAETSPAFSGRPRRTPEADRAPPA